MKTVEFEMLKKLLRENTLNQYSIFLFDLISNKSGYFSVGQTHSREGVVNNFTKRYYVKLNTHHHNVTMYKEVLKNVTETTDNNIRRFVLYFTDDAYNVYMGMETKKLMGIIKSDGLSMDKVDQLNITYKNTGYETILYDRFVNGVLM